MTGRRATLPLAGLLLGVVPSAFASADEAPIVRRLVVEFGAGTVQVDLEHALREDEARAAFAAFDGDRDGTLSDAEVEAGLVPWRRDRRRGWTGFLEGRQVKVPFAHAGVVTPRDDANTAALSIASTARFSLGAGEHSFDLRDNEGSASGQTQVIFRARDGAELVAVGVDALGRVEPDLFFSGAPGKTIRVRARVPRKPIDTTSMAVFISVAAVASLVALLSWLRRLGSPDQSRNG